FRVTAGTISVSFYRMLLSEFETRESAPRRPLKPEPRETKASGHRSRRLEVGTYPALGAAVMRPDTTPSSRPKSRDASAQGNSVTGVAGTVFVAIKHFVVARFRSGTLETLCRRLDADARDALLTARPDTWYPSALLLSVLHASFETLTEGD